MSRARPTLPLYVVVGLAGLCFGGVAGMIWAFRGEIDADPLPDGALVCTRVVRRVAPPEELSGRIAVCRQDVGGAVGFRLDGGLTGGPVRPEQAWTLVRIDADLVALPGAPRFGRSGDRVGPGELVGVVQGSVQWGPGQLEAEEADGLWRRVDARSR